MYLYLFYGNFQEAMVALLEANKWISGLKGTASFTEYCFLAFLVYISAFQRLHWQDKIRAYFAIRTYLRKMRQWAAFCPINFLHKQLLMEAEFARFRGKRKKAVKFYEQAIEVAKKSEFLKIEALATELAAKFYLANNQTRVGRTLMLEAYYAYYKWGAQGKLKYLEETYPDILTPSDIGKIIPVSETQRTGITTTATSATTVHRALDINTIVKASQIISSEIELEKLIKQMMHIVIENAGAEIGWLILEKEGIWKVEAEAGLKGVKLISEPISTLPQSIINSVIYSKTPLLFSNPAWLSQFTTDPYIQRVQPKSVLCMPLLNHGVLSAILYLENNLTKDAFTPDRLEILNLLGSQIAISLDNAKL
jgi:GAF domain-containing protein